MKRASGYEQYAAPAVSGTVAGPSTVARGHGQLASRRLQIYGFDPQLVERITRLVDVAEYKRRQTPPGVRVTPKAFGKDRRLPITNAYRG